MKLYSLIFALIFLTSCTKIFEKKDHLTVNATQNVVKEFVQLSAAAKDPNDKMRLKSLCSGDMKDAFDSMSDEVFRLSYLESQLTIEEISFVKTQAEAGNATLQYRLKIVNNNGVQPTVETIEREVKLVEDGGSWLLASIKAVGVDKIEFVRGMVF